MWTTQLKQQCTEGAACHIAATADMLHNACIHHARGGLAAKQTQQHTDGTTNNLQQSRQQGHAKHLVSTPCRPTGPSCRTCSNSTMRTAPGLGRNTGLSCLLCGASTLTHVTHVVIHACGPDASQHQTLQTQTCTCAQLRIVQRNTPSTCISFWLPAGKAALQPAEDAHVGSSCPRRHRRAAVAQWFVSQSQGGLASRKDEHSRGCAV